MRKARTPNIVTLSILSLITIVLWVFFSIYRLIMAKPAPVIPKEILAPINPDLDTRSLEKLNNRLYLDEGQLNQIESGYKLESGQEQENSPKPTPLPQRTPRASP